MMQNMQNKMGSGVFEISGAPSPVTEIPPEPQKNEGLLYPGQRWIELSGRFTPEELRRLADTIEAHCAGVPKRGDSQ